MRAAVASAAQPTQLRHIPCWGATANARTRVPPFVAISMAPRPPNSGVNASSLPASSNVSTLAKRSGAPTNPTPHSTLKPSGLCSPGMSFHSVTSASGSNRISSAAFACGRTGWLAAMSLARWLPGGTVIVHAGPSKGLPPASTPSGTSSSPTSVGKSSSHGASLSPRSSVGLSGAEKNAASAEEMSPARSASATSSVRRSVPAPSSRRRRTVGRRSGGASHSNRLTSSRPRQTGSARCSSRPARPFRADRPPSNGRRRRGTARSPYSSGAKNDGSPCRPPAIRRGIRDCVETTDCVLFVPRLSLPLVKEPAIALEVRPEPLSQQFVETRVVSHVARHPLSSKRAGDVP